MINPRGHVLKTVAPHFDDVWDGNKTAELRINDRNFDVGEQVVLAEYDLRDQKFVGRFILFEITHILLGSEVVGIEDDYCVLSFNHDSVRRFQAMDWEQYKSS